MIAWLNHIAHFWWAWTAAMFWQVSLLILLIGCLDLLIRKWAWPQLRYALWSLVLVKLLLPPSWSLPSGLVPELRPRVAQVVTWLNTQKPSRDDSIPRLDGGWRLADSRWSDGLQLEGFAISEGGIIAAGGLVNSMPVKAYEQTPYGVTNTAQVTASPAAAANPSSGLPRSARNGMVHNPQFEWPFYAMSIWFLGTLVLGIWLWLRLHSTAGREAHRAAAASLPQSFYNHLAEGAKRLGLRRIPRVVVTRRLTSPAVFGVFRPVLLMPKGYLRRLSRRDTEHILLHELAHIKRGDLVMHGLYLLLQIVYWYQPLLWLVRRHLHHLRELSCDGTVAELLREGTPAYRRTLLETARRMLTTSVEPGLGLLGLFEDSNHLLVRLNWLTKPTWRYSTMKRVIALAVALLMFACVLPMAQGQEPASNEEVAPVSTNEVVPVNAEEVVRVSTERDDQKGQDQLSKEIAKLQAQLEQLKDQQQDLQNQLKALAEQRNQLRAERGESGVGRGGGAPGIRGRASRERTEGETRAVPREPMLGRGGGAPGGGQEGIAPEAREQLRRAQEQARRAQDEVKRAMKEADRARQEAMRAQVEARRHAQAEGQDKQAWAGQWERWAEGEPMKNWQRDMEKWGKQMEQWGQELGQRQAAAVSGSASESESREMPSMPPMPPMPAMPAMPPVPVHVPQIHVPEIHVPPVPPVPPILPERADGRETVSRTDTRSIDLPAGMLLEVANEIGSIRVHGGDGPGGKVVATVKAKADTKEKAQQIADQIELVVTPSDGKTRISMTKPEQEGKGEGHDYQVTLDIAVPRSVQLKVSQAVGNIHLTNLRGDIDASAKVGSIQATDVAGRVSLNAEVGSIGFFAPRQFSAKVQAKAAMGSIQSDFPLDVVKPRGVAMGSSASGTIGDGEGELSLKTNVGSIGIRSQDAAPGRAEPRRAEPRPRPEPRPQPSSEREL
jgi:beta-lactamase regulating signal transducer with metallopeptidase domain